MPLAVSATTFKGSQARDVDEGPHVRGELVEQVEVLDTFVADDAVDTAVGRCGG